MLMLADLNDSEIKLLGVSRGGKEALTPLAFGNSLLTRASIRDVSNI